jgi:hypothetical protein
MSLERLDRLREDIEYGIKQEYFFHYPREMAKLVMPPAIEHDWKVVLASFPSSRREIEAGMDRRNKGEDRRDVKEDSRTQKGRGAKLL